MKTRILFALFLVLLPAFAQNNLSITSSTSGTGSTINSTLTIPLGPSTMVYSCVPSVLLKGSSVACTATLDQPVPAGQTATTTLSFTPVPGVTITITPTTFTIPAGSSTCGTAALPCFTVARQ